MRQGSEKVRSRRREKGGRYGIRESSNAMTTSASMTGKLQGRKGEEPGTRGHMGWSANF